MASPERSRHTPLPASGRPLDPLLRSGASRLLWAGFASAGVWLAMWWATRVA